MSKKDQAYVHNDNHSLYLQILPGSLQLVVIDKKQDSLLHSEIISIGSGQDTYSIRRGLEKAIKDHDILSKSFKKVRILIYTDQATLVPNSWAKEEKNRDILKLNFGALAVGKTFRDKLESDRSLLFQLDKEIYNLLQKQFPEAKIKHPSSVLLDRLEDESKADDGEQIHVLLAPPFLEVIAYKDRKLVLRNAFGYQSPEDLQYFMALVVDQLHFDPAKMNLYLSGSIERKSDESALCEQLCPNIHFPNYRKTKLESGEAQQMYHLLLHAL